MFKPYKCKVSEQDVAKAKRIKEGVKRCEELGPQVDYYWTTCRGYGSNAPRYPCQKRRVRYFNNKDMGCCGGRESCLGTNCNPCEDLPTGCVEADSGEFSNEAECEKSCNTDTYKGAESGWACDCCELKSADLDKTKPENYKKGQCREVKPGVSSVGNIYATEQECLEKCNAVAAKAGTAAVVGFSVLAVFAALVLSAVVLFVVWRWMSARSERKAVAATKPTTYAQPQQQLQQQQQQQPSYYTQGAYAQQQPAAYAPGFFQQFADRPGGN